MGKVRKHGTAILLVDDEASERIKALHVLHSENCEVVVADSCRKALDVFKPSRNAIDLLITDIALPDGNGCRLALMLREMKPDLRVLFVSGYVGAEFCRYSGLDVTDLHFLRKPFQPTELVNSVRRVLRSAVPFPRTVLKTRTA